VPGVICGQAQAAPVGVDFPIFVGEWSLQTYYNNSLELRSTIFQTELYAWQRYMAGGAFWNIRYASETPVDSGEGGIKDYWSFLDLIDAGVIPVGGAALNASYC
jgi:glucan 1,3-beta-glucosidase